MGDPKTELDARLRAYLDEEARAKREGHTIANLRLEFAHLVRAVGGLNGRVAALESDRDEVHERLAYQGRSILALKRRARTGEDDEEMSTGQYDLADIKRRVEEQEEKRRESERVKQEDATWWSRFRWQIVASVATALTVATISGCAAYVIATRSAPPSQNVINTK